MAYIGCITWWVSWLSEMGKSPRGFSREYGTQGALGSQVGRGAAQLHVDKATRGDRATAACVSCPDMTPHDGHVKLVCLHLYTQEMVTVMDHV